MKKVKKIIVLMNCFPLSALGWGFGSWMKGLAQVMNISLSPTPPRDLWVKFRDCITPYEQLNRPRVTRNTWLTRSTSPALYLGRYYIVHLIHYFFIYLTTFFSLLVSTCLADLVITKQKSNSYTVGFKLKVIPFEEESKTVLLLLSLLFTKNWFMIGARIKQN